MVVKFKPGIRTGPRARVGSAHLARIDRGTKAKTKIASDQFFAAAAISDDLSGRARKAAFENLLHEMESFQRDVTYKHVRSSNREYYKALAAIYEFARRIEEWPPRDREQFIDRVNGGRLTAKQTLFHVLLRNLIKYPEGSRQHLSRDARALMHAANARFSAKDLVQRAEEGGGGLDRMAREFAASRAGLNASGPNRATKGVQEKTPRTKLELRTAGVVGHLPMGTYVAIITSLGDDPPFLGKTFLLRERPNLSAQADEQALADVVRELRRTSPRYLAEDDE